MRTLFPMWQHRHRPWLHSHVLATPLFSYCLTKRPPEVNKPRGLKGCNKSAIKSAAAKTWKAMKNNPPKGKEPQSVEQGRYICINCGNTSVRDLYKNFSNSVKTLHCHKCRRVADKYIECESLITLVDVVLLSEQAFRHTLYNNNFKLQWKLSVMLLLLDSFALWRKRRSNLHDASYHHMVHEKGFYICCLQNIFDYLITIILLGLLTHFLRRKLITMNASQGLRPSALLLLKVIAVANFSKFFLLPIMVWRQNTTELGSRLHYLLVMGHHVLALINVYAVSSGLAKLESAALVLPLYFTKEYFKTWLFWYLERWLI